MDRRAWWATVHEVMKIIKHDHDSEQLSMYTHFMKANLSTKRPGWKCFLYLIVDSGKGLRLTYCCILKNQLRTKELNWKNTNFQPASEITDLDNNHPWTKLLDERQWIRLLGDYY